MAILRRQAQIGAAIAIAGVVLVFLGLPHPLSAAPSVLARRRSAAISIAVQRSITTSSPAVVARSGPHPRRRRRAGATGSAPRPRRPRGRGAGTAPSAGRRRPCRTARSRRPRRQRPEGRHAEDVPLVRVDRDALEPLLDEVAEDAERRPRAVRRRPDHGDPAGRPQGSLDARVVQDRDRPAPFLEVQECSGPIALLACQVAASRSYGCPSAAGGMLRPTTPARIDDRDEVRQGVEELAGQRAQDVAQLARRRSDLDRLADPDRRREEQRRAERAERCPAPDDHRGQPDEPAPGGHPLLEGRGRLHAQERAAKAGQDAAREDVPVAQPDDVDADRLGGPRVLADGAAAQAPARSEEEDLEPDDDEQQGDRDRALGEERREDPADERQVGQERRRRPLP